MDGPIFPCERFQQLKISDEQTVYVEKYTGITKREYFAGLAMQGYLSNWKEAGTLTLKSVAEGAVRQADALISELEKGD